MERFKGIQARGNAVEICGPRTGHIVKAIAYCDSEETAAEIVKAIKHAAQVLGEDIC